jgi:hypothetical protein
MTHVISTGGHFLRNIAVEEWFLPNAGNPSPDHSAPHRKKSVIFAVRFNLNYNGQRIFMLLTQIEALHRTEKLAFLYPQIKTNFDIMAVIVQIAVFWVVIPYSFEGGFRRFGEISCLLLYGSHNQEDKRS